MDFQWDLSKYQGQSIVFVVGYGYDYEGTELTYVGVSESKARQNYEDLEYGDYWFCNVWVNGVEVECFNNKV
ncbi:MAG: hypothetical protein ACRC4J_00115 [Cetobacterium sp.]